MQDVGIGEELAKVVNAKTANHSSFPSIELIVAETVDELSQKQRSRAATPFERTKEVNELQNRKLIVWRFDSFGRIETNLLNDPRRQVEIDNSQIRCLGIQCLRIIFKFEPVIANCE